MSITKEDLTAVLTAMVESTTSRNDADLLNDKEVAALLKHYSGNPGLRSIEASIKDYAATFAAYKKDSAKVSPRLIDAMFKDSARLRKLGKEDGVLK